MAPENIAVVVTVSVLGGVVVIALVVVCVAKVMSDKKLKKIIAREQGHGGYGDMMALEETHEHPSYVHYPEPEPYTPTHPPETDPWRMSNMEPTHDTHDHGMTYDPSRRPSLHQPYIGPPNGATNMQRRASDMPRRVPNVGGVQRRVSRAEILQRHKNRRSSKAATRAPSVASQIPKLPTRRGSLQPNSEPPTGENKKLWYFYINEKPDYYSRDLERKREQAKERVEKEERSRASEQSRVRRRESLPMPHSHPQAGQRRHSFQHAQPYAYPYNPGPSTQYI